LCLLAFCTGVLAIGKFALDLGSGELQTLTFTALVFGGQATIYAIRERRHLWKSPPSRWLLASSLADLLIAATLACAGLAMTRLPIVTVAGTLAAAAVFALVMDAIKVPLFARLRIA
jgi:H+-transporting ATPase